jgi:hypothetical protein
MSQQWWMDDDQLLAALREALQYERIVPAEFIAMGKAAFTWRGIDAELATLSYDSALAGAGAGLAGLRSESASLRYLTFTSGELTLEIEVTEDALHGQLVPPGPGQVEARTADGDVVTVDMNQVGGFTIRPIPPGSFRLYCHTTNGTNFLTSWLVLRNPPED